MASKALLILGLLIVAALFVTSDAGRELAEETKENIEKMATENGVADQKGRGGYNRGSPSGGGYNGSGYPESGNIVGGGFPGRCSPDAIVAAHDSILMQLLPGPAGPGLAETMYGH